jgi:hypothetical protein
MFVKVVATEAEYEAAVIEAMAIGMELACVSNTGLDHPEVRLTFLPKEIFLKPGDPEPVRRLQPINVREWLAQHT